MKKENNCQFREQQCKTFTIFVLPNKLTYFFITMEGKVKWFDPKKGYGFIIAEDGKEVFVHYTGIVKEGFKALNEGQIVSYEIGEGDKGVQAVNVQILPKAE